MAEAREGIFRKQALEKMASPERLDELIRIVAPKDWLLLGTMLAVSLALLAWCIWGKLPTTVDGEGMIVRPRRVVEIQSQASGRLVNFDLHVGDDVRAGETIGTIDQAEIRKQLEEDRAQLAVLEQQDRQKTAIEKKEDELSQRDFVAQERDLQMQITNAGRGIQDAQTMNAVLQKRIDALHEVIREGIEPKVSYDLLQTQKQFLDNQAQIPQLQAQRSQWEDQIKAIQTKKAELARTRLQASSERRNQILELRGKIALAETQLEQGSRLVSAHSGRVLEVNATPGQVLGPGSRLAYVEEHGPAHDAVCVMYFSVRDGKRIRPGMHVLATPDSVRRERFGGIVGKVVSVSSFPVTREGAALELGNSDIATRMLQSGPRIEVVAALEPDARTASGYQWSSSRGPRMPITEGTTAAGRVTIENRPPITYLLPFLRGLSGLE